MTPDVLVAHDVTVAYGARTVLQVSHLGVRAGEVLTIVGPNGAGKSTLLRVLALLEAPTRGTLTFGGAVVEYRPARLLALRRRMSSVFQAPLLCDTTVFGNVALGLRFRHLPAREIERRVQPWLERFGIAHMAGRAANTLSGGEAQRTSLARAFVLEPEVLFLDEPFGALDAPTREGLLLDLASVLREAAVTTIFVTHDRGEALLLGDRVAVVMGGRVIQMDEPDRVFSSPATEEVARFVGADTIVAGEVRERHGELCVVAVGNGQIEVQNDAVPGERLLLCVRPETVALAPAGAPSVQSSVRNSLLGKIKRIVPLDVIVRVDIDAGFELRAYISKQSWHESRLSEGEEVRASFKTTAVHVIRRQAPHEPR